MLRIHELEVWFSPTKGRKYNYKTADFNWVIADKLGWQKGSIILQHLVHEQKVIDIIRTILMNSPAIKIPRTKFRLFGCAVKPQ